VTKETRDRRECLERPSPAARASRRRRAREITEGKRAEAIQAQGRTPALLAETVAARRPWFRA